MEDVSFFIFTLFNLYIVVEIDEIGNNLLVLV